MRISLEQTAGILNLSVDTVLFISRSENRLISYYKPDDDIIYNEDGTVSFTEGNSTPTWEFEFDDVLAFKKQMDEGLVGEVEGILEGK